MVFSVFHAKNRCLVVMCAGTDGCINSVLFTYSNELSDACLSTLLSSGELRETCITHVITRPAVRVGRSTRGSNGRAS